MNDASAVLASLDKFIERFAQHGESTGGHRVATQNEPLATINPLTSEGRNHSGHSGHPGERRPASEMMTNDATPAHLPSRISMHGSRVKSYLLMVTVVRVANPLQIKDLPVATAKMSVVRVVTALQIKRLRAD